jgi:hypothetical protein
MKTCSKDSFLKNIELIWISENCNIMRLQKKLERLESLDRWPKLFFFFPKLLLLSNSYLLRLNIFSVNYQST